MEATKSTKNSTGSFKVYKASAGTGKTFTLISEFLAESLNNIDEKAYRHILATTFTNKATKELKGKLFTALMKIIGGDRVQIEQITKRTRLSEDEVVNRAGRLFTQFLHDYSSINISTIDGFVQRLSRSFASELNLSYNYNVLINTDDLADEIVETFGDELTDRDEFVTAVAEEFVSHKIDEEKGWKIDQSLTQKVRDILGDSKGSDDISRNNLDSVEMVKEAKNYIKNNIKALKEECNVLKSQVLTLIEEFIIRNGLQQDDINSNTLKSITKKIEKDEDFTEFMTKTLVGFREDPTTCLKKSFKGNNIIAISFGIELWGYLDRYLYDRQIIFILETVMDQLFTLALTSHFKELIKANENENGNIPLSEFNRRISELLGDFSTPFIYERVGDYFKHIFIDEFQDTSILQWHNFLPLVDNGLSGKNMSLVVGDAKQAIYRFRGGEVEQIINLPDIYNANRGNPIVAGYEKKLNEEHNPEELKDCYRSARNIIDFNNRFFSSKSHDLNGYESVYKGLEQIAKRDLDGLVQIEVFDKDKSEDGVSVYPERCYQIITDLHNNYNYDYRDMAILTNRNEDGVEVATHLQKNRIPIVSSESILLRNSNDVMLIISALRYVQEPANKVNMANLLYYRNIQLGKTAFEDIGKLFATNAGSHDDAGTWNGNLINLLNIDSSDLLKTLSTSCSLYDLCESLVRLFGLDSANNDYVRFLLEDIHENQTTYSSVKTYLEHWDDKNDKLSVKTTGDADAVRIMSVHKSKGLEFKVVIYPYAENRFDLKMHKQHHIVSRGKDNKFECIDDDIINNIPNVNAFDISLTEKVGQTMLKPIYDRIKEKSTLDATNLLYVALTRPKDRLYVLSDTPVDNKKNANMFSLFCETSGNRLEKSESEVNGVSSTIFTYGKEFRNEKVEEETKDKPLHASNCNTIIWFKQMNFNKKDESHNEAESWGLLIHEILSKVIKASDIDTIVGTYVSRGLLTAEDGRDLTDRFNRITEDRRISEAFGDRATVRTEMEFIDSEGNTIRPDRFVELDGKIMIIDYKTGAKDSSYHSQLKKYAAALSQISSKPIECYLLYIGEQMELEQVNIII